jgi:hypothetical protein
MANFVELTHTGRVVEIQQQVPNTDVVDAGADGALQATSGMLWGVGAVSTQLDIARPTLRTWDRGTVSGPACERPAATGVTPRLTWRVSS